MLVGVTAGAGDLYAQAEVATTFVSEPEREDTFVTLSSALAMLDAQQVELCRYPVNFRFQATNTPVKARWDILARFGSVADSIDKIAFVKFLGALGAR